MKDIRVIDLIISDINKFLIKERISPVKVNFLQNNGVPYKCDGDITNEKKQKVNEYLIKYKDQYEIIKLIIEYRYGNTTKMQNKIGKKQLGKRYKNYIKNEAELMDLIGVKNVRKLL